MRPNIVLFIDDVLAVLIVAPVESVYAKMTMGALN